MLRIMRFLKPYRLQVLGVLVLLLLQAMAQLMLPTLMADIVDVGVVEGDTPYILRFGAYMLGVAAVGTLCAAAGGWLSARAALGFARDLRSSVFSHVSRFSLQELDRIGTASLITRTTNDITQVQQVMVMMLRLFIYAPIMCLGGIVMAVSRDAELSLVLAVFLPVLLGLIFGIARQGSPYFKTMQLKLDRLNLVLRESLTGLRVIRSFGREAREQERFGEANEDLTRTAVRVNRIMGFMMPGTGLILNFAIVAVMWYGSERIHQGDIGVGDLMAYIQYAMQIMFSLTMLSMMFMMIPRAAVSAARIHEVLDTAPGIVDAGSAGAEAEARVTGTASTEQTAAVEFRDVTFRYPGAEQPAVRDLSFRAEAGQVTAFIGGTGSGKTTVMNLLIRFYEADSGTITVGGQDIRQLSQENLRSRIGYVPQRAVLFSGTLADNIRFGREEAGMDEIRQAAETAQAAEFIAGLPGGYDAVIAQGGSNLSGGQKQRLSIARALLRRPDIYIFDDSFSALDYRTDARLRAALMQETRNAAVLIVAQRVSTIREADRIVVLNEGRIAGIGTHEELLERCGVYREIVSSQVPGEEEPA